MRSLVIVLFILEIFGGCSRFSTVVPRDITGVVERVQKRFAPDKRLSVFDIRLEKKGDQLIVTGEVNDSRLWHVLKDSIQAHAKNLDLVFNVVPLPEKALGDSTFAVVDVSTAHLRRQPKHAAELLSQAVLGSVVRLLKKRGGWYFVQMDDRYLGWMSKTSFWRTDSAGVSRWKAGNHVIVKSPWGWIKKRPTRTSTNLSDVVAGCILPLQGKTGPWYKISLPGGKTGFLAASLAEPVGRWLRERPTPASLAATGKQFLGLPYLWGGTSSKGFDCSGFVQTVFKLNHIRLPRDANQMALEGEKIDPGENFQNLKPGDLLFFGAKPDKITHVALSVGKGKFYHADGYVHENSLVQGDSLFNAYRFRTFRMARRILKGTVPVGNEGR
ncbi:MAG: C40 family peptidase [Calditrichaeota bacterium]|nr:C40 family peptidase [Calditrichota bacterium]